MSPPQSFSSQRGGSAGARRGDQFLDGQIGAEAEPLKPAPQAHRGLASMPGDAPATDIEYHPLSALFAAHLARGILQIARAWLSAACARDREAAPDYTRR
jgi:hypothetical protein